MAFTFNQQVILGHVGSDPEVRYTPNGHAVATFSIATNRKNGEDILTTWHRCVAWKSLAEFVGENVKKGALVFVRGETQHKKWIDKDEKERIATEITVHELILCSARAKSDTQPEQDDMATNNKPQEERPF